MADDVLEQETHTRRRRNGLAAAIVMVVVAAFAGVAWVAAAYLFRAQVEVSLGEPACRGSKVVAEEVGGRAVAAMAIRPAMRCRVDLLIRNDGPRAVSVRTVRLTAMGPQGGSAVEVRSMQGRQSTEEVRDGIDASFPTSISIEADTDRAVPMVFQFREGGCTAKGLFDIDAPTLRLTSLGLPGEVASPGRLYFRGTKASQC